MLPFPIFLADVPPMSAEWQLGLNAFLMLILLVLAVWDRVKPKEKSPPDHEVYATKKELKEMGDRLTASLDSATVERNMKFSELGKQLDGVTTSLQNGFQEIFYKLGVVEGESAPRPSPRARRPKV